MELNDRVKENKFCFFFGHLYGSVTDLNVKYLTTGIYGTSVYKAVKLIYVRFSFLYKRERERARSSPDGK